MGTVETGNKKTIDWLSEVLAVTLEVVLSPESHYGSAAGGTLKMGCKTQALVNYGH